MTLSPPSTHTSAHLDGCRHTRDGVSPALSQNLGTSTEACVSAAIYCVHEHQWQYGTCVALPVTPRLNRRRGANGGRTSPKMEATSCAASPAPAPSAGGPGVIDAAGVAAAAPVFDYRDSPDAPVLRFCDYVHGPLEAQSLARAVAAASRTAVQLVPVNPTVSAPKEAEALRMFGGGNVDFGVM